MGRGSTATVRERGQVTIPVAVRKQANLEEGTVVEFEVRDDGVLLRPTIVTDQLPLEDDFVRGVIQTTTETYAALRADEAAWADELAERAVLEGSLSDGVEDE